MVLKSQNREKLGRFLSIALMFCLPALAYLPLAGRFGYYYDDWYLMYSGFTQGTEKFFEIFAIDRPARAYFVSMMYSLFGTNAPLYSYSAYLFRVFSALGLLWIFQLLWPEKKKLTLFMAALFVVYPGFLDQPNAIDYQSHIFSFSLAIFSIALTIKAILTNNRPLKRILTLCSAIFALGYLFLMEYYIGLEVFRFLLIFYVVKRSHPFWKTLKNALFQFIPSLLASGSFLFWRIFLFDNQRAATDIGSMFNNLASSPVMRLLWNMVYLIQDFLNVTFLAWSVPLYQIGFRMRLRDNLFGLLFVGLSILVFVGIWYFVLAKNHEEQVNADNNLKWGRDVIVIGVLSVVASLIPVVLGDRHIQFPAYGRFSLPGSAGAVLIIGGMIWYIKNNWLQFGLVSLLLGSAIFTHYANSVNFVNEWESVRDFWWQVSWRIPQIAPGTVLVADYPESGIVEDYFVWGPANLVYYPEKSSESPTPIQLPAAVLTRETVNNILRSGGTEVVDRRSLEVSRDFGNILVLSMPSSGSCVHVINGKQAELSDKESYDVRLIADRSNLSAVLLDASFHVPPAELFGAEPPYNWCHTYALADLARQKGDWVEVARLGDEAIKAKDHPNDWVEWMPFVQAYAYLGEEEKIRQIMPIIKEAPYLQYQGCLLFKEDQQRYAEKYPEGQKLLIDAFCN